MGRFVAALILAALVLPAPRARAQTTPEEHTVNELQKKSRAHLVSGSFLMAASGALVISGGVHFAVDVPDYCTTCRPSAAALAIAGSVLLGVGALSLVPGAVLLSKGVKEKRKAELLASGKATLSEIGEAEYLGPVTGNVQPGYVDQRMGKIKRMAAAGFVLVSLALASAAAGWIFWGVAHAQPDAADFYTTLIGWETLIPASVLFYAAGSPCLLYADVRARHLVGIKPIDGVGITGWVFYGIAWTSGIQYILGIPPVFAIVSSASLALGSIVSLVAGARATRIASKHIGADARPITLVPSITPLPGGISIGVAGAF
jgi:hypothetical protein